VVLRAIFEEDVYYKSKRGESEDDDFAIDGKNP
jgi:hypothetical protein